MRKRIMTGVRVVACAGVMMCAVMAASGKVAAQGAPAQNQQTPRQNGNNQQHQNQNQQQQQNQNQNQQGPPKQPPADVMGSVHAADTGTPLKKAQLILRGQDGSNRRPLTTTTDNEGNFHFQGVDPGRYRLSCTRNGYVAQEYEQKSAGQAGAIITLKPSQTL